MTEFEYTIKDESGIHARPAGLFVKAAQKYKSSVEVSCGEKKGDGKRVFGMMSLGAAHGATITVKVDGEDEKEAAAELQNFLEANL